MLTQKYNNEKLMSLLIPKEMFRPFPTIDDRRDWESQAGYIREHLISEGERYAGYSWTPLPVSLYMEFIQNGNRSRYEEVYFRRRTALGKLVTAECVENKGRFIKDIINGIWAICEESSWVIPAHIGSQDGLPDVNHPVIDLFAAETGALLSWIYYLLGTRLDNIGIHLKERITYEVKNRIVNPYLLQKDFPWMGFVKKGWVNNWTPWCTSNCLTAVLLLEENPDHRRDAAAKAIASLDVFLDSYHSDGGCDEGPGYWGHAGGSLFDCLELLFYASGGRINVYDQPLIQEIGRYIYRVHVSQDYYVNFADSSAVLHIPSQVVYGYGKRIDDRKLMNLGSDTYIRHQGSLETEPWYSMFRFLHALFHTQEINPDTNESCMTRDVWMEGIQVMTARQYNGSCRGLYLAVKGGHNNESHNHNDVGQFIIFANGSPAIIDVGVETYTSKTFSSRRYEIWTMQSMYHNLPTINGIQQQSGRSYEAKEVCYQADDGKAEISMDIAAAYPQSADVDSWKRTLRLHREQKASVELIERFILRRPSDDIMLSFMTPCKVNVEDAGTIVLTNEKSQKIYMTYDMDLSPSVETINLSDKRLQDAWGERIFRILLKTKKTVDKGLWRFNVTIEY